MERIFLARRISVIHAIKCANAIKSETAKASSDYLSVLMERLDITDNPDRIKALEDDINNWAGTIPIATDYEISNLMNLSKQK
ncbi:hypothetical protein [Mucilaginibacter antarcticus]